MLLFREELWQGDMEKCGKRKVPGNGKSNPWFCVLEGIPGSNGFNVIVQRFPITSTLRGLRIYLVNLGAIMEDIVLLCAQYSLIHHRIIPLPSHPDQVILMGLNISEYF